MTKNPERFYPNLSEFCVALFLFLRVTKCDIESIDFNLLSSIGFVRINGVMFDTPIPSELLNEFIEVYQGNKVDKSLQNIIESANKFANQVSLIDGVNRVSHCGSQGNKPDVILYSRSDKQAISVKLMDGNPGDIQATNNKYFVNKIVDWWQKMSIDVPVENVFSLAQANLFSLPYGKGNRVERDQTNTIIFNALKDNLFQLNIQEYNPIPLLLQEISGSWNKMDMVHLDKRTGSFKATRVVKQEILDNSKEWSYSHEVVYSAKGSPSIVFFRDNREAFRIETSVRAQGTSVEKQHPKIFLTLKTDFDKIKSLVE